MATGPPANPANPTQPPDQNPPQAHVSWDGDRMFNIYILDYCRKRGYEKTAAELAHEADIPSDSQPPINAKQGLLFEWWSVFWVLFAAKSSGQGPEDAILYTQHMNAQAAQRQNQNRIPQQQVNRFMNGIPRQGVAPQPGTMPNGVGPAHVPPPTTMPNGAGPSSQPQLIPGQRPGIPQQRPVNGAPFSSPTMAHSPQASGGGGPQPNPAVNMSGSMGQSQQMVPMNRGMLPPNGPQGMPGVRPMTGAHQTPQPAFQPLGPSPNQPGSPSQPGPLMAPSPSMASRQPPGMQQQQLQEQMAKDMSRIDQNSLHQLKAELNLGNKEDLSLTYDEKRQIIELARSRGRLNIPKTSPQGPPNAIAGPSGINMAAANQQQRLQMGQQSLQSQSQNPQQRSVKRNSTSPGEDHAQLPRNESSPPANKRQRTSPPGGEHPQPVIPPHHPQQSQQPQQPQHHQQPPMAPMVPFPHPPQQGGPGGPQLSNGMLRPMVGPMQGFPHPGLSNMGNNAGMAGMSMGGVPHMANQMNPGGMMNPGGSSMAAHMQYRQSMQTLHKVPQGQMGLMPSANAASPSGVDNQYNPDGSQSRPGTGVPGQFGGGPPPPGNPNNRLMPKMNMMPPPASPRMTQQKNATGDPKSGAPGSAPGDMGVPTTSPRNSHPVPGQPQNQGMSGQTVHTPGNHTAPPTPIPANNSMPAPSPSSILGNVSSAMNPQPPPGSSQEFSFGGDIIPGIDDSFNFGGGEDFDRAFGEWFSDTPALDLK